jgi:hypothetical protein
MLIALLFEVAVCIPVGLVATFFDPFAVRLSSKVFFAELQSILLVWAVGLFYRAISLHVFFSWALKRYLIRSNKNILACFGLELLLINVWAIVLAWLASKFSFLFFFGTAELLFRLGTGEPIQLTKFWFATCLPISIGSLIFILFFRRSKFLTTY